MASKKKPKKQIVPAPEQVGAAVTKELQTVRKARPENVLVRHDLGGVKVYIQEYLDGVSRALDLTGGEIDSGFVAFTQRRNKQRKSLQSAWVRVGRSLNSAAANALDARRSSDAMVGLTSSKKIILKYGAAFAGKATTITIVGRSAPSEQTIVIKNARSDDVTKLPAPTIRG